MTCTLLVYNHSYITVLWQKILKATAFVYVGSTNTMYDKRLIISWGMLLSE